MYVLVNNVLDLRGRVHKPTVRRYLVSSDTTT
jgi:hypothetical protein